MSGGMEDAYALYGKAKTALASAAKPVEPSGLPAKFDGGKPDLAILPHQAIAEIATVMMFGAKKYGRDNWRSGPGLEYSRLLSATMRHLTAFCDGEDNDNESGRSHLAHAACNLLFLLYYRIVGLGKDDRYKGGSNCL